MSLVSDDMMIKHIDHFDRVMRMIESTNRCKALYKLIRQIYHILFLSSDLTKFLNNGSIVLICRPSDNLLIISISSKEKIAVIHVKPRDGTQIDRKGPIELIYWGFYHPDDKFPNKLEQKYFNEESLNDLGDKIRMIHSIVNPPTESSTIN